MTQTADGNAKNVGEEHWAKNSAPPPSYVIFHRSDDKLTSQRFPQGLSANTALIELIKTDNIIAQQFSLWNGPQS